tara:strand:+ start:19072 stop:19362 length:291 start_codon:yes stop_codon:yes gene_type:complete
MESNDNDKLGNLRGAYEDGDENVVELGRHEATVGSVITRLHRDLDKIKSITAIIEWDNDIIDLVHDSRPVSSLIFDAKLLDTYVTDILKGALDGVE